MPSATPRRRPATRKLKCHDPPGDDYYVTLTRKSIRVSSYSDEAIRDVAETKASTVSKQD